MENASAQDMIAWMEKNSVTVNFRSREDKFSGESGWTVKVQPDSYRVMAFTQSTLERAITMAREATGD